MTQNKKPHVLVATFSTGRIETITAGFLLTLMSQEKEAGRYTVGFTFPEMVPVEHARNTVMRDFKRGDAQWLLMVDEDNPPTNNPLDYVSKDLDVVVFPTLMWQSSPEILAAGGNPLSWNCMDETDGGFIEHRPKGGLQEIDAGGSGAMLVSRRVATAVNHPFLRPTDSDGVVVEGSDFHFCRKVRAAGYKVWAAYECPCRHVNRIELTEFQRVLAARDISHANNPNINTPEYWDKEWERRENLELPGIAHFYPRIVEMCTGKTVLDFGCGIGRLLEALSEAEPTRKIAGVDLSPWAVSRVRKGGIRAWSGDSPLGIWDVIVATEVLEHLDDPDRMLKQFFEHTNEVIYTVPANQLPPGIEKEHQRVFTPGYIERITPYCRSITQIGPYFLVHARRENGALEA